LMLSLRIAKDVAATVAGLLVTTAIAVISVRAQKDATSRTKSLLLALTAGGFAIAVTSAALDNLDKLSNDDRAVALTNTVTGESNEIRAQTNTIDDDNTKMSGLEERLSQVGAATDDLSKLNFAVPKTQFYYVKLASSSNCDGVKRDTFDSVNRQFGGHVSPKALCIYDTGKPGEGHYVVVFGDHLALAAAAAFEHLADDHVLANPRAYIEAENTPVCRDEPIACPKP